MNSEKIRYNSMYHKVVSVKRFDYEYFKFLNFNYDFDSILFKVEQCIVSSESGGIIVNRKVVKNTFLNTLGYIYKSNVYKYLLPFYSIGKSKYVIEEGFLLTGSMSYNYFHFLIDSLPRIIDYIELRKQKNNLKLIINYKSKFALQYLELFGLGDEDVIWIEQDCCVNFLYYSNNKYSLSSHTSLFPNFIYSKFYLKRLSLECIERAKSVVLPEFPNRIYISRDKIGTRKILNEEKFLSVLNKFNIERIFLEDYSIPQQIQILSRATIIVAVHGAGLANLIFSSSAIIFEIFPQNKSLSTLYQMQQLSQINPNNCHILYVSDLVDYRQNVFLDLSDFEKLLVSEIGKC